MVTLRWTMCGDRIFVVSSEMYPDVRGYHTSTDSNPDRNLYDVVIDSFKDISGPTLILMCERDRDFSCNLLNDVSPHDLHYLRILGNVIAETPCDILEANIKIKFGTNWKELYQMNHRYK